MNDSQEEEKEDKEDKNDKEAGAGAGAGTTTVIRTAIDAGESTDEGAGRVRTEI